MRSTWGRLAHASGCHSGGYHWRARPYWLRTAAPAPTLPAEMPGIGKRGSGTPLTRRCALWPLHAGMVTNTPACGRLVRLLLQRTDRRPRRGALTLLGIPAGATDRDREAAVAAVGGGNRRARDNRRGTARRCHRRRAGCVLGACAAAGRHRRRSDRSGRRRWRARAGKAFPAARCERLYTNPRYALPHAAGSAAAAVRRRRAQPPGCGGDRRPCRLVSPAAGRRGRTRSVAERGWRLGARPGRPALRRCGCRGHHGFRPSQRHDRWTDRARSMD